MKNSILGLAVGLVVAGGAAFAQTPEEAMAFAVAANACGDFPIASAVFTAENTIEVQCEDDATGFVPLVGGAGPALGLGGAALLAAVAGGGTSSTPDTQ